jgi:ABC-type uncharacterized transport system substrate-binding protein
MSERRACSTIKVDRKTVRYRSRRPPDDALRARRTHAGRVAAQPDVIHTWTTPAARALAAATSTIPIVAAPSASGPCQSSWVTWSARPATSRA